ncbi:hypothetical protein [Clostridium tunisiense]|uniref:hypothetical protein n=1 Tax=Clostridium tunisiense TaxID=219748 RepID=UPI0002E836D3|nr:hypothetical protein [Clostridium tunisiense]
MLEVSSSTKRKRKKNSFFNKYIILSILCIAVLASVPYTRSKISQYQSKNEDLRKQVETLKKENAELTEKNDSLNKSKSQLEERINALPKSSQ